MSRQQLPAPVSGEAIVTHGPSLLSIGGLDAAGVSTSTVLSYDPRSGAIRPTGSLPQPLHDAASASLGGGVLVFGGGSATTTDAVERLRRGRPAEIVGHLPGARSDLSALGVPGSVIVLGGYDGVGPVGSVLATRDGHSFKTVARLPVAVRYASVVARGRTIFVLGGELADGTDSPDIQTVDLDSGKAAVIGHLPAGLSHSSAIDLHGRILLLGGRSAGRTTDQILLFDPARPGARIAGRLPAPVQNAAAGTVAGTGYLLGGLDPRGVALAKIVIVRLAPLAAPAVAR